MMSVQEASEGWIESEMVVVPCPLCPDSLPYPLHYLRNHIAYTHVHGYTPFSCDHLHCGKSFASRRFINIHHKHEHDGIQKTIVKTVAYKEQLVKTLTLMALLRKVEEDKLDRAGRNPLPSNSDLALLRTMTSIGNPTTQPLPPSNSTVRAGNESSADCSTSASANQPSTSTASTIRQPPNDPISINTTVPPTKSSNNEAKATSSINAPPITKQITSPSSSGPSQDALYIYQGDGRIAICQLCRSLYDGRPTAAFDNESSRIAHLVVHLEIINYHFLPLRANSDEWAQIKGIYAQMFPQETFPNSIPGIDTFDERITDTNSPNLQPGKRGRRGIEKDQFLDSEGFFKCPVENCLYKNPKYNNFYQHLKNRHNAKPKDFGT